MQEKQKRNFFRFSEARKNRFVTDWENAVLAKPAKPGIHVLNEIDLNELASYIDWTSFSLPGKYQANTRQFSAIL